MGLNPFNNWIADDNRFNLEAPPDAFLTELHNYDSALVIIPSRMSKRYLLTRRRQYTRGLGDVAMMDNKHPDTNMCYGHHLLPITHLNFSGSWGSATFFAQLKSRDTWQITGGPTSQIKEAGEALERLANVMDDAERAAEQKQKRDLWDSMYHRGRDAWRSMQARLGRRNKRASDAHGVAPALKPKPSRGVILTDAT